MINFEYQNPTRIIFGQGAVKKLSSEIRKYGKKVLLVYGGSSLKESGTYDLITSQLSRNQIGWAELPGVTVPSLKTVYEGIRIARENQVDMVIGIGGGCCIDVAKSVALGAAGDVDIWDVLNRKIPWTDCDVLPIGAVVTIAGSGSEMDGNSEIDNLETGVHGSIGSFMKTYPSFSILDPDLTATAPFKLTAYHGACILIQALEQYFCQTQDTPIQDGFIETICRTVICSLKMLQKSMDNVNARGQLLWAGALVTSRILGRGKEAPWMAGSLGSLIEEKAGLDYTTGIAITFPKYMRVCYKDCLPLFVQFAINVMNVNTERKCDNQIAKEGVEALQKIFDDLGLAHSLKELGKDFTSYKEFQEEIDAYAAKGVISKEDLQEIVQMSIG